MIIWFMFCFSLAGLMLLFCGFEIFYIFTNAPKCGISRLWALVPLFSKLFGLIMFIYVFTKRKQDGDMATNTTTCPYCNCKFNDDTSICPICGAEI